MDEDGSSKPAAAGGTMINLGNQEDSHQQLSDSDEPVPLRPTTGQDEEKLVPTEMKVFQERVRALEAKLGLVDMINESTMEGTELANSSNMNPVTGGPVLGPFDYKGHLDFYHDVMYFLRRVRYTHQRLSRFEQNQKEMEESVRKARSARVPDSEVMKQISTEAFLKEEPAKVVQVDWDVFAYGKVDMKESVMAPIEVISSEPEPQTILQLGLTSRGDKPQNQLPLHHNERVSPRWESLIEQPLPERIKIKSDVLVDVFTQTTKGRKWKVAEDGSLVFLRPYQPLIYCQSQLRDCLANLEKQFENYDGKGTEPDSTDDSVAKTTENLPPKSAKDHMREKDGSDHGTTLNNQSISHEDYDENARKAGDGAEDSDRMALSSSITALLHLRCLVQFMDAELEPKREYINSMQCTRIHFHDLWYLFKPGDEVISQEQKQVFVVLRVQIPRHKVEEPWERWNRRPVKDDSDSDSDSDGEDDEDDNPFTLNCVYIDFDGKFFGPIVKKFKISPFGELKQITSLPVYPLRYARDTQARDNIAKRGRMLLKVAKSKAMYYMGVTMDKRDEIDSQVVIDFNEALADEGRRKAWEPKIAPVSTASEATREDRCMAVCCFRQAVHDGLPTDFRMTQDYVKTLIPGTSLRPPSLILSPRSLEDTLDSLSELTETEFLVMTYRVFGFVLRSRKWAQLDLTFLHYENSNSRNLTINAFEKLELPDGHRDMVKSLVMQHFRHRKSHFASDEQTDLIQGKGKGLILLLHGAPGVGKTTTAEGIAELFQKPLFQITCGDLGTTAKEVEVELEKNFALASRWGCILLLDEADVFLSARERMDFNRNGLVAVFLRVLEYYAGILFLTTNRIGDFDEAFASRIHMSLYYPELDEQKTLKVFRLNLDLIEQRFQKQGRTIIIDPSSIEDFALHHFHEHRYNRWNGRQIRNACQTALALAEFDAQGGILDVNSEIDRNAVVRLQLKYFRTVQRAYLDFGKYLGDIQGAQGDRRAIDLKLRARNDTAFETRPSLFSQREESRSFTGHHGFQQHFYRNRNSSEISQSAMGSQQNTYQNYRDRPITPIANFERQQGSEPYTPRVSHHQLSRDSVGNSGGYESPASFAQSKISQHAPMDIQYQQARQPSQPYESPQSGPQPGYSGEALLRPDLSPGGSSFGHQFSQPHQLQYLYRGNTGQEGGSQDNTGLPQDASANVPRPIYQRSQEGPKS
ncbi:uncharacterized protein LY79DRAFT_569008 [Colletotrichum navitas]|uniref:AAA+ ATPase domain-containing protein n=1 Tax=Colletotrichum navitas TaxID=681940 RepID=A0AAD8PP05_9PEZI|nr:uncharacterized protein LY79DRAFT_569008 [Colletotrichum navitas]KAK1573261.1 hypothetical protein LY79DRAFT_569008 [Colletotrichum navitas]